MNAFLAEDDVVTRHLLQTLLTRWGYTIRTADDGNQAMAMLPSIPTPSLVLLDWMMPGVAGTDVCRRLRQLYSPQQAYVIMLTALNQPEDVVEGLEAGVDDYLSKPMTPVELRARLQIGSRILSIENDLVEVRKSLSYELTHDESTGLLTKNSILTVLDRTFDESLRENVPMAVAMVRVDSTYARSLSLEMESALIGRAGESISIAARSALQSVRAYDAVGRFGDDRFLVIFPGVGRKGASNLAMRLLAGLGRTASTIPIAANIGLASTDGASTLAVESLIEAAEQGLRTGIAKGLNRIEFASVSEGLILPSHLPEALVQH